MPDKEIFVLVLYNHLGEDEYEKLKQVDESQLDSEPEYPVRVATVREEYASLVKALRQEGFIAGALNLEDDISKLEVLVRRRAPDVIFNLVKHFRGQPALEADVAGLLELHGIPYTGAPPFSLTLCQRKGLTQQLLLANGIPTPRYQLLETPEMPRRHGLRYPLIVKPAWEDASSGVEKSSVVHDLEQLGARLKAVFEEYAPPILVEEFMEGRELHVSILGNDAPEVLPINRVEFLGASATPSADH